MFFQSIKNGFNHRKKPNEINTENIFYSNNNFWVHYFNMKAEIHSVWHLIETFYYFDQMLKLNLKELVYLLIMIYVDQTFPQINFYVIIYTSGCKVF